MTVVRIKFLTEDEIALVRKGGEESYLGMHVAPLRNSLGRSLLIDLSVPLIQTRSIPLLENIANTSRTIETSGSCRHEKSRVEASLRVRSVLPGYLRVPNYKRPRVKILVRTNRKS